MPGREAKRCVGYVTGDCVCGAHRVTTDVPQTAATECRIETDVGRATLRKCKAGRDRPKRTNRLVANQFQHARKQRLMAIHERFGDDALPGARNGGYPIDVL